MIFYTSFTRCNNVDDVAPTEIHFSSFVVDVKFINLALLSISSAENRVDLLDTVTTFIFHIK